MAKRLIHRAGTDISINLVSDAAEQTFGAILDGLGAQQSSRSRGIRLRVNGDQEEWRFEDKESSISRKLSSVGDLIYHLTDRIVFHIASNAENSHCLHAAAVEHNGQALIIPANSGAGKSTFTAWLVNQHFRYITDELIVIGQDDRVTGLTRPIQIKPHGLAAIENLLEQPSKVLDGSIATGLPVDALGGELMQDDSAVIGLFVFPKFKKGSDFEFSRLSSAEAGMRLMANHVNARNLEGHGFRAMMKLIRQTPCYALDYGAFTDLPDDYTNQLKTILSDNSRPKPNE